jgi:hypothetical protein
MTELLRIVSVIGPVTRPLAAATLVFRQCLDHCKLPADAAYDIKIISSNAECEGDIVDQCVNHPLLLEQVSVLVIYISGEG